MNQRSIYLLPPDDEPGLIMGVRDAGTLARWTGASALCGDASCVPEGVAPVVAWSGSMGQLEAESASERASLLFARDPRTWGPKGWAALDEACERMLERSAGVSGAKAGWALRTHAQHVLSDAASCAKFLARWGGETGSTGVHGLRVLYEPATMLTAESIRGGSGPDLLRRFYEAAGTEVIRRGLLGVVVSNVCVTENGEVRSSSQHGGEMDLELIVKLASELPREIRLVTLDRADAETLLGAEC